MLLHSSNVPHPQAAAVRMICKQLVQEECDCMRKTLDSQVFLQIHNDIRKNVKAARDKMKREEKLVAVANKKRTIMKLWKMGRWLRSDTKSNQIHEFLTLLSVNSQCKYWFTFHCVEIINFVGGIILLIIVLWVGSAGHGHLRFDLILLSLIW